MNKAFLFIAVFFLAVPTAIAADGLDVETPYAFATASSQKNGAVFAVLRNSTDQALEITGGRSPVSESVELHTMRMDGDTMQMRQVEAFSVPAQASIALEPSGDHIMLMGLSQNLTAGETFPLTLVLKDGGEMEISVSVTAPGAAPQ